MTDKMKKIRDFGIGEDEDMTMNSRKLQQASSEELTAEAKLRLTIEIEKAKIAQTEQLMKQLQTLLTSLKNCEQNVRAAAHEVREYPVKVVQQMTTRVEQSLINCESAARQTKDYCDKASKMLDRSWNNFNYWIIIIAVLSSAFAAAIMFSLIKRWL